MAAHKKLARDRDRLNRLLGICEALPEMEVTGDRHLALRIRKKTFGYYLDNHHDDGIVGLACKSTFQEQLLLVNRDPDMYYVPAYVGAQGWVGYRLDRAKIDWDEVARLLFAAYRLQAPRRLAEQVE